MADEQAKREGREGARWINYRPSAEEVAEWFRDNVILHEGLEHEAYVGGITLIQSVEKSKEVIGWKDDNKPIIQEIPNVVHTPYPRVDMRVKYWNDLMAVHADEWVGVIEPVVPAKPNEQLPPGFFSMAVGDTRFACCSMKATVYKRGTVKWERLTIDKRTGEQKFVRTGEIVMDPPPATKMIPLMGRYGADPFSLMKAETGATGRALGLAGMLIVPGSGVATAEDLAEAQQMVEGGGEPAAAPAEAAPPPTTNAQRPQDEVDAELRGHATVLIDQLREEKPDAFKDFQGWCKQRGIGKLSDTNGPALKGVVKQLEKALDAE